MKTPTEEKILIGKVKLKEALGYTLMLNTTGTHSPDNSIRNVIEGALLLDSVDASGDNYIDEQGNITIGIEELSAMGVDTMSPEGMVTIVSDVLGLPVVIPDENNKTSLKETIKLSEIEFKFDDRITKESVRKVIKKEMKAYLKEIAAAFCSLISINKGESVDFAIDDKELIITLSNVAKPKFVKPQIDKIAKQMKQALVSGNSEQNMKNLLKLKLKEQELAIFYDFNDPEPPGWKKRHQKLVARALGYKNITNSVIEARAEEVYLILNLQKEERILEIGPGMGGRKGNFVIYAALKGLDVVVCDKNKDNLDKIKAVETKLADLIEFAGGKITYIEDINEPEVKAKLTKSVELNGEFDHVIALSTVDSKYQNKIAESNYKDVVRTIIKVKKMHSGSIYCFDAGADFPLKQEEKPENFIAVQIEGIENAQAAKELKALLRIYINKFTSHHVIAPESFGIIGATIYKLSALTNSLPPEKAAFIALLKKRGVTDIVALGKVSREFVVETVIRSSI